MQKVLTLILGGGQGRKLFPLTKSRSEPAVPVAGKYRLIDIPISNCLNSEMTSIYVLTQFQSASLHTHIGRTYKLDQFSHGFIELLAAQQTYEDSNWYEGTADAIRQHLHYIQQDDANLVLILSSDQFYRMNFRDLVETHRRHKADVTMALTPVTGSDAVRLGIARMDDHARIVELVEKPESFQLESLATSKEWLKNQKLTDTTKVYLANMGIYLFNRQKLLDLLGSSSKSTDLVREVLQPMVEKGKLHGHLFKGYWRDVGTIRSYYESNLALASENPPFDFHSSEGVIYTRMRNLPAARVLNATTRECLLSDAVVVQSGTELERCVIGVRSQIGKNVKIRDSIIIGSTHFQSEAELSASSNPPIAIGDNTQIEGAILDKDCCIGKGVRITSKQGEPDSDHELYYIRDGLVIIPRSAVIPDGTVI